MDALDIAGRPTARLRSMALDGRIDLSSRLVAVVALGARSSRAALDGLRAVVEADDEVVVQRAVERLGKVGTPADVDTLRAVRTGDATTQRVLRAAKCFLSYRHRLGAYRIDEPKQRLEAASTMAAPIVVGAATKKMTSQMELVPPPVPGVDLMASPARRFECGSNEFALLLNRQIVESGPASLAERQALPAVLTRYNEETGAYDPAYYLLADPIRGGRFRLTGVRGSGRAGLAGSGVVGEKTIEFEINATDVPLDHPLTVRGSYDLASGAVRVDVALVEPRFSDRQQRRRKQPRLVTRPD